VAKKQQKLSKLQASIAAMMKVMQSGIAIWFIFLFSGCISSCMVCGCYVGSS
jgi:hypothetical protein